MAEEVLHGHLPPGLNELQHLGPTRIRPLDGHLQLRHLGEVPGHRVVHLELPFLDEHHHGDARDGLGHRGEPEEGVARHGSAGRPVAEPEGLEESDFALARDQDYRPGHDAGLDVPVGGRGEAGELGARQAHRLRRGRARQDVRALRDNGGGGEQEQEHDGEEPRHGGPSTMDTARFPHRPRCPGHGSKVHGEARQYKRHPAGPARSPRPSEHAKAGRRLLAPHTLLLSIALLISRRIPFAILIHPCAVDGRPGWLIRISSLTSLQSGPSRAALSCLLSLLSALDETYGRMNVAEPPGSARPRHDSARH